LIEALERFAYDWASGPRREPVGQDFGDRDRQAQHRQYRSLALVARIHAKMIERLADAKAKVIGYTVFFSEPQLDPGLAYVNRLLETYQRLVRGTQIRARRAAASRLSCFKSARRCRKPRAAQHRQETRRELRQGGQRGAALLFTFGEPRGKPDKPLPEFVRKNALSIQGGSGDLPLFTSGVEVPIVDSLGAAAAAVGHLNSVPTSTGRSARSARRHLLR